jgi:hypothetical protein
MLIKVDSETKRRRGAVDWMATTEDGYGQVEGTFCGDQVEDVRWSCLRRYGVDDKQETKWLHSIITKLMNAHVNVS